jgi:hypothetical protein
MMFRMVARLSARAADWRAACFVSGASAEATQEKRHAQQQPHRQEPVLGRQIQEWRLQAGRRQRTLVRIAFRFRQFAFGQQRQQQPARRKFA